MTLTFTKATKQRALLRQALFGPSGSGKTFTALRIATGMGGKIAFIDTERGSASKYADRFDFDVLELPGFDIDTYVDAINAAAASGQYPNLIIDSLSHGWKELLDEIDKLAKTKYRGNTWSAWSEGTPKQSRLVNAILNYPGHVIATMRTKTEWTTEVTQNGKSKPVRVGLAPEQGKGIEYEFDLLVELTTDHIATVIKDRTGKFQDKIIEKPGESFGAELVAWLNDGAERTKPVPKAKKPQPKPAAASPQVIADYGGVDPATIKPISFGDDDGEPEPETKGEPHWIDDPKVKNGFWAWVGDQGLSSDEVYKALAVESMHGFDGNIGEAKMKIHGWAAVHAR